jgi:hypothetical protein
MFKADLIEGYLSDRRIALESFRPKREKDGGNQES